MHTSLHIAIQNIYVCPVYVVVLCISVPFGPPAEGLGVVIFEVLAWPRDTLHSLNNNYTSLAFMTCTILVFKSQEM